MMNSEKARELFSDYREGSISTSLKASFESCLASDLELKREYVQFDELLTEFEKTRDEVVEVPFDLHDKIMARIDKSLFEERRKAKVGFFGGRRLWFAGGIAAVAIVGTVLSLKGGAVNESNSGLISTQAPVGLSLATEDGKLHVRHGLATGTSVLVKDESTGKLVKKFDLEGKSLDSFQENSGSEAVLLRIESNSESLVVAVPSHTRKTVLEGRGSVKELAKAVADTFLEPVQVGSLDLDMQIAWVLDADDPLKSKATAGRFSLERRKGMLYLTD